MVHLQCLKPYFLTWSLYCRILWAFSWTIAVLPKKCMVQSLAMYDCCEVLSNTFQDIFSLKYGPLTLFQDFFFFCHTYQMFEHEYLLKIIKLNAYDFHIQICRSNL